MLVERTKPRIWGSLVIGSALLVACAHERAPVVAPPSAATQIVVENVPTQPIEPRLTKGLTADQAAEGAALRIDATVRECRSQWFGDDACDAEFFKPFVEDLPAAQRLSVACEDRCRDARVVTIHAATEEAGRSCAKATRGHAACEELGKQVGKHLPEREADLAEGACEGMCDTAREQAAYAAKVDARRPRTKSQEAACEARCHQLHDGGWCGTPLMGCLMDCVPMARP